ncbi:mavicyanin-like [Salvia divinorum]|uniref:Mavicyanin-like n=2 Tax=Salvia divinorum TaxID=28513 RepID=A0ABD1GJK3_SALDI
MRMRMAAEGVCLIVVVLGWFGVSKGEVYKVGDSAGWTTIGNIDYKLWSATKTFQLGDVIVFEYNPQFHNVMQVVHSEYKACNASSPISTHTTGNDSIAINTHGHHFFVCGVPGHCQSGQKLDINVLRSPSPTPSFSAPLPPPAVPSPSPSAAPPCLQLRRLLPNFLLFYLLITLFA